jgi:hypothetical protein
MNSLLSIADQTRWASNASRLRQPLVRLVSANQDEPPHHQVLTPALAVVLMAKATGQNPHEIINQTVRMVSDVDGPFATQWRAMEEYVKHELRRHFR